MEQSEFRLARARQWLGWTNNKPAVSMTLQEDAIWMLAMRDRPLRITACGSVALSVGTIRHGELRLVGLAADAIAQLAAHLRIPDDSPAIGVVSPSTAFADAGHDAVNASLIKRQVDAVTQALQEAGFGQTHLDSVPAALARVGRVLLGPVGYAAGSGWLTGWVDEISEVTRSGSLSDSATVGGSPSSLLPVTGPAPIKLDNAVALEGPWPLLVGAALSIFECGPKSEMTAVAPPAYRGWAAEPIGGVLS